MRITRDSDPTYGFNHLLMQDANFALRTGLIFQNIEFIFSDLQLGQCLLPNTSYNYTIVLENGRNVHLLKKMSSIK